MTSPNDVTKLNVGSLSLREMLDLIDTYLVTASERDAERLWDVLSALRGPDADALQREELHTTAVIRTNAFPRAAQQTDWTGGLMFAATRSSEVVVPALFMDHLHFYQHSSQAARALGLTFITKERTDP